MAIRLKQGAELSVGAIDLAAILTEHFCGYGPLDELEVVTVVQSDSGNFEIEFGQKPKPPTKSQESK